MIGSIILVLINPNRRNNKEYLKSKYLKLNRIFGFMMLLIITAVLGYFLINIVI